MKRLKQFFGSMGPVLLVLGLPSMAKAQVGRPGTWGELFPSIFQIGVLPIAFGDLPHIIGNIVRILLIFAGLTVLFYLIIGGYQYTTAGGNAETAAAARTTILNAVIGIIIIFASYALVTWLMGTFIEL